MKTASVPVGFLPNPDKPNISNTLWTSVSDNLNKRYYFQSSFFPNLIWVDLDELELGNNEMILELPIESIFRNGIIYSGNVTKEMSRIQRDKESFQFILG